MSVFKTVNGMPDPFAPFEEKQTEIYGLKIAKVISAEWFSSGLIGVNCSFTNRREYVRNLRLFVRGEQLLKPYKDHQSRGEYDLDFMNVDWSIINKAEKYCRLVSNAIGDDKYRLDIRSVDFLSLKKKNDAENEMRKNMYSMPMLKKAKEVLGIDMVPQGFVPENEEELQLMSKMNFRSKIEAAEEILINHIKNTNNWGFIEKQKNIDLVDIGLGGVRVYIDKNDGVKLALVDPENYIHSRVSNNDFSDKYYEGVVDTITLSDLRREANFSDIQLRELAMLYSTVNTKVALNYNDCDINQIIDYKIDVLRFAWKTSKTITYKKKIRKGKTVKVTKKPSDFYMEDMDDAGTLSRTLDTWFEGNHIVGSNAIYGYRECENISRDLMNSALSPFVFRATNIYENRPQSFLTKIIPLFNDLQNMSIKLQTFIAELKGDIVELDIDMLAELGIGKGNKKLEAWEEALTMLNVKNIVIKKRADLGELGVKEGTAAKVHTAGVGGHITALLNAYAFKENEIRAITGINEARDGTIGDDALLGVNEMRQMASNTVTKHIVDAAVDLNQKVCELISNRVLTIFKHKEASHIKEIYTNVVGKHMMDALEVLADRSLHEFGFTFEMIPTNQELAKFEKSLELALGDGSIDVEVKVMAEDLAKTNINIAYEFLFFQRKKRNKERMEEQMALAKNKSENDSAAANAKVQAEIQGFGVKKQIEVEAAKQLSAIKVMEADALNKINEPKEERKFEQEVYLTQLEKNVGFNLDKFKEDRKDQRTRIQATQQSKTVDQRERNSGPIDFENEPTADDLLNN